MDQCDICDEKSVIYEDRQRIECYIVVTHRAVNLFCQ